MPQRSHNDAAIWFILIVVVIFLSGSFVFIQYEILQIKNSLTKATPSPTTVYATLPPTSPPTPVVTTTGSPIPTPSPKMVYVPGTQAPSPTRITYIPLSVAGESTQKTDWTNITSSSFTLNIGDYGSKAYSTWDASIRVDNANGTTYARLFDTTHGIAVNGSEISISNTSTSTDVISGSLSFWSGNNSYVVQIKSLNGSTAFIDSGRIKINY